MPKLDGPIGSQILDEGMTPAQWIEILARRECVISERTLREKANDKGAFYRLGRAMLITPQQIDIIFEEGQTCRSQSTRGAGITTSMLYNASPKAAKQLIPVVEEIGNMPLRAISGALLKGLGPQMKPKAFTDTWWREIVTPASAVINNAHELEGTQLIRVKTCN